MQQLTEVSLLPRDNTQYPECYDREQACDMHEDFTSGKALLEHTLLGPF